MNGTATSIERRVPALLTCVLAAAWLMPANAEVSDPYTENAYQDERYEPYGDGYEDYPDVAVDVVIMTPDELAHLVGPIALYPDDLLAIALPASTYPLQIVQAVRYLDEYDRNPSLQPRQDWDESVVALLNYPEVLQLMHDDLDWTWSLGTAVLNQQQDVIEAVEVFRDQAYIAGNLRSDRYQTVDRAGDTIEIRPANEQIIYVPYYEPRRVIVYQSEPVFAYHPRPRPVYYYPYRSNHAFYKGLFWGVTTAYGIAWSTHDLRVYHHSYRGHPYFGRRYTGHYYRQPAIRLHDAWYAHNARRRASYRHHHGDVWRPRHGAGARPRTVHTSGSPNHVVQNGSRYRSRASDRYDASDAQRSDTRVRRRSDTADGRRQVDEAAYRQRTATTVNAERPPQRSEPASSSNRPDRRRASRPTHDDDASAQPASYRDRARSNANDTQSRRVPPVIAGRSRTNRPATRQETSANSPTQRSGAQAPRRPQADRDEGRHERREPTRQAESRPAQRRVTGKPGRRDDTRKDREQGQRRTQADSGDDDAPDSKRKGRARN